MKLSEVEQVLVKAGFGHARITCGVTYRKTEDDLRFKAIYGINFLWVRCFRESDNALIYAGNAWPYPFRNKTQLATYLRKFAERARRRAAQ